MGLVGGGEFEPLIVYVQEIMSCVAVAPPVAPVKPANAAFAPTVAAMFIGQLIVNVSAGTLASVMVIVRVVPSYVMCTLKTSPLCRFTPPPSATAGVVGSAPLI